MNTEDKPAGEELKEKKENSIKLKDTIKQTILHYIDKDNPKTYLNQCQAYMAAHPGQHNYNSARVQSSRLFAKPNVRAEIDRLLRQHNAGIKDRIASLANILAGTHQRETVTTDNKGNLTKAVSTPTATEIIRASQELNKMEGTLETVKAEITEQSETIRDLRKAYLSDILRSTERVRDVTPVEETKRETGGEGQAPPEADEFNLPDCENISQLTE